MSFSVYPSYSDSDVEWLGKVVPSHWSIERLRVHAKLITAKAEAQKRPIALENIEGWTGKLIETDTEFQNEGVDFKVGDILFGKLRPYLAKVHAAEFDGQAVGDFHVIRPASSLDAKFLKYCLLTRELISLIDGSTYGAKMPRASWDFIREVRLAFPPVSEQIAIASFLDREVAKIDALIEKQKRLIVLLREKRQSIVSHAVTKGLDAQATFKDSGTEWLGKVPTHWELYRVGQIYVEAVESGTEELPILSVSIHSGVSDDEAAPDDNERKIVRSEDRTKYKRVRPNDLVYNMMRAWQGGFGAVQVEGMVSPAYVVARPRIDISAKYIECLLRTPYATEEMRRHSRGITDFRLRLYWDEFKDIRIALPPPNEVQAILAFIDTESVKIDALVAECELGIALMQERRKALISAAVTGKIDVRSSAQVIPFPINRARARGLIAAEIITHMAKRPTFGRVKLQKLAYLAEAHVGAAELGGNYLRMPAGPLDSAMVEDMEREAGGICGVVVEQPAGAGTAVTYRLTGNGAAHKPELQQLLGPDRAAKLSGLIKDMGDLDTKSAEAVATLYAVWNDALIDGEAPDDDRIVAAFLNDWHPEKSEKFRSEELRTWLGWMRRHGLVPAGAGPKTYTGRLFV